MKNPLLSPSALPYGLPPFANIGPAEYSEAVAAGLTEHLAEIQAIVDDPAAATFENAAVAMERAGQLLQRASASFFTLVSADASEEIRDLETKLSPRLSEHHDEVYLNRALFDRFTAIDRFRQEQLSRGNSQDPAGILPNPPRPRRETETPAKTPRPRVKISSIAGTVELTVYPARHAGR
ncbi:MAG: hypothetical protein NVS2B15_14090 [Pseudarthrobacter sp.]